MPGYLSLTQKHEKIVKIFNVISDVFQGHMRVSVNDFRLKIFQDEPLEWVLNRLLD
jgi:hypothetical protein